MLGLFRSGLLASGCPHVFGTHSLRRTKATLIYRRTGNLRAVQLLLGHRKIESTVRYLGMDVDDALTIAEQVERLRWRGRAEVLCPSYCWATIIGRLENGFERVRRTKSLLYFDRDKFAMAERIFIALAQSKVIVFSHTKFFGSSCATYLAQPRQRLARELDSRSARGESKPIVADPWVVSSLLQKSIRRGEVDIARRAAMTLSKARGAAIWRRLIVIAFEDIGIGSVDAVTMTVAATDDSAWRRAQGGDIRLAVAVAGILAEAPKDRSADYLVCANDHPALAGFAQEMASASLMTRLCRIGSRALDLPHRAWRTLFASG